MQPVKLAIAGCGLITDEHHLPAALSNRGVEVAALIDTNADRANLLTRKYGLRARVETQLTAVIDDIDAVVVATPNHTHFELASLALTRGRPVLIEKPMTITHAEALELCSLSERYGAAVSVGFVTRHFPVVTFLKRLFDQGSLGPVRRFHFEFGTRGGWAPLSGYNLSQQQSGGGVLVVSGTHFLDRMLFWFGEPTSFRYADDSFGGVEANCKAWLGFGNGLEGTLFFSKTMQLKNKLTVETDSCVVELPWGETEQITLRDRTMPDTVMTLRSDSMPPRKDPFQLQMDEFVRVVRDAVKPTVNAAAGAASVKLCESLYAERQQLEEPWAWYRYRKVGTA